MDINELSDQEKSVILAKLAKLHHEVFYAAGVSELELVGYNRKHNIISTYTFPDSPSLYHPANMGLAWRVLNWANNNAMSPPEIPRISPTDWRIWTKYLGEFLILPPQDAQRAWLDKILSLAIEAGLVGETS